jgi:hypothetical protein
MHERYSWKNKYSPRNGLEIRLKCHLQLKQGRRVRQASFGEVNRAMIGNSN